MLTSFLETVIGNKFHVVICQLCGHVLYQNSGHLFPPVTLKNRLRMRVMFLGSLSHRSALHT